MHEPALERAFVDAQGRLLWPWRLVAFCFFTTVALLVALSVVYPATQGLARAFGVRLVAYPWLMLLALAAGHALTRRLVDRDMTWQALGLGAAALRPGPLVRGLVLGALAILLPCLLLLGIGWLRLLDSDAGGWTRTAAALTLMLAPAAFAEELLLRGYPMTLLRERFGWHVAVVATSVCFAALHAQNPGAGGLSLSMVAMAGVFLGAVRVVTGSLYAAGLAHLGWNWVMAAGLHVQVSGLPSTAPGYRVVASGPAWATGGSWGPEGGLFAAAGMCAALAVLFARPAGRDLLALPIGRAEAM